MNSTTPTKHSSAIGCTSEHEHRTANEIAARAMIRLSETVREAGNRTPCAELAEQQIRAASIIYSCAFDLARS